MNTDLNTEGTFGCEVSTDAPVFRTVRAEKDLRIYGEWTQFQTYKPQKKEVLIMFRFTLLNTTYQRLHN